MASAHNLRVIPHAWGSGVGLAAALQICASLPLAPYTYQAVPAENEPIIEFDRTHNPLRDDLLVSEFAVRDGYVDVPTGPGLGVKVDMDVVAKYAVA